MRKTTAQNRSPMAVFGAVWLLAIAVFLPSAAFAVPVYNLDAGLLVGIDNLEVNGTAYNVEFRDGRFQDVYDLTVPFPITESDANAFSRALALSVLDVPAGNFDSDPLLTRGCAADFCLLIVPNFIDLGAISVEAFRNAANAADDERTSAEFAPSHDTTGLAQTLTVWSVANVAGVPEPEQLGLLAFGLLLLRRRLSK